MFARTILWIVEAFDKNDSYTDVVNGDAREEIRARGNTDAAIYLPLPNVTVVNNTSLAHKAEDVFQALVKAATPHQRMQMLAAEHLHYKVWIDSVPIPPEVQNFVQSEEGFAGWLECGKGIKVAQYQDTSTHALQAQTETLYALDEELNRYLTAFAGRKAGEVETILQRVRKGNQLLSFAGGVNCILTHERIMPGTARIHSNGDEGPEILVAHENMLRLFLDVAWTNMNYVDGWHCPLRRMADILRAKGIKNVDILHFDDDGMKVKEMDAEVVLVPDTHPDLIGMLSLRNGMNVWSLAKGVAVAILSPEIKISDLHSVVMENGGLDFMLRAQTLINRIKRVTGPWVSVEARGMADVVVEPIGLNLIKGVGDSDGAVLNIDGHRVFIRSKIVFNVLKEAFNVEP